MRSRTANWFECKVKYTKTMEDGLEKDVTELYVVNAESFADAEKSVVEAPFTAEAVEVKGIKQAPYKEIFFSDEAGADRWYKAKLQFITIDEKTEKEKRSNVNYLVQASTLNGAVKSIDEVMGGTMIDYVQANVGETKIVDVFEIE